MVLLKHLTEPSKGLVHPKMKILSLITHPHVVPKPSKTLVHLWNTNEDIFDEI